MANKIWKYGWEQTQAACETVAQKIADAEIECDMIVGISRGGLIPATMIAHILGVKRVGSFQVGSYEAGVRGAIQDLEDRNHLIQSVERAENVLVIEDIVDTGNSMAYLKKRFAIYGPKIAYASLVVKGHKAPEETWPDFYDTLMAEDAWVHFPWEIMT